MTASKKPKAQKFRRGESRMGPLGVAIITAILGFGSAIALFEYERPRATPEERLTEIPERPHTYSLISEGRTVSGESSAPFEKGDGYLARVEACDRYGIEGLMNIASCYVTIRPSINLVISNSQNPTEARYTDGSPAKICCMLFEDDTHAPIYRIK